MKRIAMVVVLSVLPLLAVADCNTNTYFINGRTMICVTCCNGPNGTNCTTNCF